MRRFPLVESLGAAFVNYAGLIDQECILMFDAHALDELQAGNARPPLGRGFASNPTLEGFAHSISVSSKVLIDWSKVHEDFGESYARAKDIQFKILVDRGLTRQYDPTAFAFVAKNITWMADKQQLTGPDGGAIPLEIRVTRVER